MFVLRGRNLNDHPYDGAVEIPYNIKRKAAIGTESDIERDIARRRKMREVMIDIHGWQNFWLHNAWVLGLDVDQF